MKLLVVRYGRLLGQDDPEQARAFLAAAEGDISMSYRDSRSLEV
jgi:hypothetical protein